MVGLVEHELVLHPPGHVCGNVQPGGGSVNTLHQIGHGESLTILLTHLSSVHYGGGTDHARFCGLLCDCLQ